MSQDDCANRSEPFGETRSRQICEAHDEAVNTSEDGACDVVREAEFQERPSWNKWDNHPSAERDDDPRNRITEDNATTSLSWKNMKSSRAVCFHFRIGHSEIHHRRTDETDRGNTDEKIPVPLDEIYVVRRFQHVQKTGTEAS